MDMLRAVTIRVGMFMEVMKMRFRTLAFFYLGSILIPSAIRAQDLPNQATLEIHGLLLTAAIDKFAYSPGEPIRAMFKVVNPFVYPITIDAPRTCSRIGQMEWMCERNIDVCFGYPDHNNALCTDQVEFPHGETLLQTKVLTAFDGSLGESLYFRSGYIEFFDPWGQPVAYRIILEYDNSKVVAVQSTTWGSVKQLYKQ